MINDISLDRLPEKLKSHSVLQPSALHLTFRIYGGKSPGGWVLSVADLRAASAGFLFSQLDNPSSSSNGFGLSSRGRCFEDASLCQFLHVLIWSST
jgi:hypothetical protein